jgi:hypothetical protein
MADDQQPTRRALRKLKRRAENEFFAQEARFWIDKIKSADRMLYDRPVDRNAIEEIFPKVPT